ncbi:MAG: cytochrome c3 family protein [Geoalkalibacter sp.]|uniref:cytochrome c3 family protein n=1 Tax=Geoalkalibacter sp. TaxID=3041440 RepID=UPI003D0A81CB
MKRLLSAHIVFSLVILTQLLAATSAAALEIVYPADKTYVTRSNYLIIKTGDPEITGITVSVNNVESDFIDISAEVYRETFNDIVILLPQWDAGRNQVVVAGYKGEGGSRRAARETASIYYLADLSSYPPQGYEPYVMHNSEREALCAPCHDMNPGAAQLSADTQEENACGTCHKRMLNKDSVHGPAAVWACGSCHEANSVPNKYRLKAEEAELCNACHVDKMKDFKSRYFAHGPVGAGLCTVCHDPHASDHPSFLHGKPNAVCLACHEGLDKGTHVVRGVGGKAHPLEGPRNPLDERKTFSCVSCHDPHGGEAQFLFVREVKSSFALCQECHPK